MQLELIEKLADENLAELWVGRLTHPDGQRLVTVRRLLRAVAATPGVVDALREASRTVAGIRHPNLLAHIVFAEAGGDHYWVTQRLEGFDLAMALNRLSSREVHISPLRTLKIGEDFLAGLAALHAAGQFHGGLDPRHVLVGADGVSRLDGMGYESVLMGAKELKQKARRGRKETLPPEVQQGRGGSLQADVFSAAAILYRLLTGQAPLGEGGGVSTRHQAIQPPSKLDRSLPFSCDAVFVKALGVAPRTRHENGAALQRAVSQLRRALFDGPDEGAAGVVDFVTTLFPNEAFVAGMPGTLMRPAKGEAIQLQPISGGPLPPPAPAPEAPAAAVTPPVPARPTPPAAAPPPVPARLAPAAPAKAWSEEFEAPPVPLSVAGKPADASPEPVDLSEHVEVDTDVRATIRDTQVMPVVGEESPAQEPEASETAPAHDTREVKVVVPSRPFWRRSSFLAVAGLLATGLIVALVLALGGGLATEPELPALGPPTGPTTLIGYLSVSSDKPAQITLDGELLPGTTPLVKKVLPAGRHRVVLTLPNGKKVLDEVVEVTPGDTRELQAAAEPAADAGVVEAPPKKPPPPPKKKPVRKPPPKKKQAKVRVLKGKP